jgi:cystathionine beta-synthase
VINFAFKQKGNFKKKLVKDVMCDRLETVSPQTKIEDLQPIFEKGFVVIVEDNGNFLGLITKIDLLNYQRRKLSSVPN